MPVQILHHWHEDKGFRKAKILNQAVNSCQADYVVFLDGDCLPHKDFVRDHMAMAEKGYFVRGRRCFVRENQVDRCEGRTSLLVDAYGKSERSFKSFRFKPM